MSRQTLHNYMKLANLTPEFAEKLNNDEVKFIPNTSIKQNEPEPPKPFKLPDPCCNDDTVIEYLEDRGIDRSLIDYCIENGSLYESKKHHNCVFLGFDGSDKACYCFQRGTKKDSNFKNEVESSNKAYGFVLASPRKPAILRYYESPIEALSGATLMMLQHPNSDLWKNYDYLSAGGTSALALLQYLKDHPRIENVILCPNTDDGGMEALKNAITGLFEENLIDQVKITIDLVSKKFGDHNLYLQNYIEYHEKSRLKPKATFSR